MWRDVTDCLDTGWQIAVTKLSKQLFKMPLCEYQVFTVADVPEVFKTRSWRGMFSKGRWIMLSFSAPRMNMRFMVFLLLMMVGLGSIAGFAQTTVSTGSIV